MSTPLPTIAVIVASTRTRRFAEHPLAWTRSRLAERDDLNVEVIDLREHPLPFFDLESSPAATPRRYLSEEHRLLGERFDAADGFFVITSEFNHGYPAALKNALDHYMVEFRRKPIAFLGYGSVGGSRAIEQLRQVSAELDMVSIKPSVNIIGAQMPAVRKGGDESAAVLTSLIPKFSLTVHELLWWANALRVAREADAS
ncbi:NADPH-dependent FMN reductase [soil metagenome]